MSAPRNATLPAFGVFGGVLAAAGLPIYIFAPSFFAENYGVSLTAMAAILFWLRLFDAVQDPVLGWISERLGGWRRFAVALGCAVLAAAMIGLFAIRPPVNATLWFGVTLTALFTAYSFLSINFYAQGVATSARLSGGHLQLAAWRETGGLLGVCLAAVLPTLLALIWAQSFSAFALIFAAMTGLAVFMMRNEWAEPMRSEPIAIRSIFEDLIARRLLVLALVNALPLAITSTLFLFFVSGRLEAEGWDGALLLLFFISAACAAPFWTRASARYGTKPTLMCAMGLAIVSFGVTIFLGPGDQVIFACVCIASGASIGADIALLPALFAKRMAQIAPNGGQGFGLWSLVNKVALAFAAIALFPILESVGFDASATVQKQTVQQMLTVLYACVPMALKLIALLFAWRLQFEEGV